MEEPQRQVWCLQAAAQNFPRHALEPRLRLPVATWLPGWAPGPGFASGVRGLHVLHPSRSPVGLVRGSVSLSPAKCKVCFLDRKVK